MTKEILERKDIRIEDTWDISSIFFNLEEWEKEYSKVKNMAGDFSRYRGGFTKSHITFLNALKDREKILRSMDNIYTYAHLLLDQDTRDSTSQALSDRAMNLYVMVEDKLSFFIPELLACDENLLMGYIRDNEDLDIYKHYIGDAIRLKPHILSAREESILAQMGEVGAAPGKIYSNLNNADLKFPTIYKEDGEGIQLSHGNFIPFMESKNRDIRKKAFKSFYGVYKDFKNTFASTLSGEIQSNIFQARLRNYESTIEASLNANNIPLTVYHSLIKSVNENLDGLYKYIDLRKEVLGFDNLHMYDLYRPIVENYDYKISYDESVDLIKKALAPLGDEYMAIVEEGFQSRWIDKYENKGKRSGAYSSGSYDSIPFILLNYHETMDNLFTIAHEMGHSVHSYLTRKHQPFIYGNYSIFLAEVASTVNEVLLLDYMIKNSKSQEESLYLINHYLESFRTILFRQTMFAEFEEKINRKLEAGTALTADYLSSIYLDLNRKYYGENIIIDNEISVEWARIPHFYYNFYVYQYATGFSAAVDLAEKILKKEEGALEKYIEFLKSGSSDYPINILKRAGIDMTSELPVNNAIEKFKKLISEFKRIKNKETPLS